METALKERMQLLIGQLNRASDAYYNGKEELMTDYEWDKLFDELQALEKECGEVLPDSPTGKVSADKLTGQKEAHEYPMLSLAKTKQVSDLVKWAEMKPIWISWKLDGLTLVVTYDEGKLSRIVTRGNGHIGTNITHLAEAIQGIPISIEYNRHLVIRGEAVISYEDFERFNLENEEEYANPRNLASGSLTLKNIDEVKARKIRFMPFTLVDAPDAPQSWGERMMFLDSLGFRCVEHAMVAAPTADSLEHSIAEWTEKVTDRTNPYPVDGLVVVYDDTEYAQTGSVTGHHATRSGLAFKWQDESSTTTLKEIEWSCATSTISPVAIFEPVELEGTTVERASLCNISECERLGIGGEGTVVSVIKANKIIPKVIAVQQKVGIFAPPAQCPVCHAPTIIRMSEHSETKTLHCTNQACPAKELKRLARLVSKEGLDIAGLSEQTLQKFINLGWINEPAHIYTLSEHAEEMEKQKRFGVKSTKKLLAAIERSRQVTASKLLYALNIPLCGLDVCKRLLSAYPLDELLHTAHTTANEEVFAIIPGIGPEKSKQFVRWMKQEKNHQFTQNLLGQLRIEAQQQTAQGEKCKGLTFVVTGDVHHFKNRNELKNYIESQGGKVTGSVSKQTNYLINNDLESASGKNKKAKELQIPIISEDEFVARFR